MFYKKGKCNDVIYIDKCGQKVKRFLLHRTWEIMDRYIEDIHIEMESR